VTGARIMDEEMTEKVSKETVRLMAALKEIYPNGPEQTTFEAWCVATSVLLGRWALSTQSTIAEVTEDFKEILDKYNEMHVEGI
jgi:hypothetical protein